MDGIAREVNKLTKFNFKFNSDETPITRIRFSISREFPGIHRFFGEELQFLWISPTGRETLVLGPKPEVVIGGVSLFFSTYPDFSPSQLSCKIYSVSTKLQVITIFLYRQVVERLKVAKEKDLEFPTEEISSGEFTFPDGKRKLLILTGDSTMKDIVD